ncbi:MAG: putative peptidase [uncultured marine phage]|uniref:Putative peptidase n=1 Tax=uncultured marine phage TaxID=707152 RepID=A0A8D9C9I6_9VIRU|nr:MAG: putative peptidase [uncultured marine phage]
MDTTKLFLQLTSETYPHGTEGELENILPKELRMDGYGNYFLEIGEDYTTMFTSHLDTACPSSSTGKKQKIVHRFSKDGKTVGTNGKTILGADCKAGVVVMLNMIENQIPGLYYFFLGEEVGCKGSKWLSAKMYEGEIFPDHKITKVVSFDRRGTNSIITYQWAGRCASDAFADGLIEQFGNTGLKMQKDPTGVCTDSIQFQDFIPECTNISVGYYSEHTGGENQDLEFLKELSESVTKIDWESLPVERDPSVTDYGNYSGYEDEWYGYGSGYGSSDDVDIKTWHPDYTTIVRNPITGEPTEVYISLERIALEKKMICDILESWGMGDDIETEELEWNGRHLILSWDGGENLDSLSRRDLSHCDSRLQNIKGEDIKIIDDEEEEEITIEL